MAHSLCSIQKQAYMKEAYINQRNLYLYPQSLDMQLKSTSAEIFIGLYELSGHILH